MREHAFYCVEYIIKNQKDLEQLSEDEAAIVKISELPECDISITVSMFNAVFKKLELNMIAKKIDNNRIKIEIK